LLITVERIDNRPSPEDNQLRQTFAERLSEKLIGLDRF
jgi:hypothetical protein